MGQGIFEKRGKEPLWFKDIEYYDLSTTDWDPEGLLAAKAHGQYVAHGVGVKNATETAGFIRAVTLAQFEANNKSLTGVVPRRIDLNGGDWCLTPVVKIFAANHGTYPSTGMTNINIGWILP